MNFINRIFGKKSGQELILKEDDIPVQNDKPAPVGVDIVRYAEILNQLNGLVAPSVCGDNFLTLFRSVPEVFWHIDYIAKRISEAHFDLKRTKDDSIVWCNRIGADQILKRPNPVTSWRELVYQHFIYKMCTGNAFLRAAMPETFSPDALKCQWCDNYWELPANKVSVIPVQYSWGVPVFGIATKDELIKGYQLKFGAYSALTIPHYQIWHDRDGLPDMETSEMFMKSYSRLLSVKKPIANLIAVYEARNVIYLKRGALGFIVAQKEDPTGTVALEKDEKEELRKTINANYGVGEGKTPYGVTDIPINFVRTNLSISELQPFDETLEDAIKIASVFGIPAVLVPRKDQSTFSNQDTAEKSVYTSTIIPAAKRFCEELTAFLGLEQKGFYIDCDFSDVACLQTGRKEQEQVETMKLQRGLSMFNAGIWTLDDVRASMHEDCKAEEIPLFGKLKFEMTPNELAIVNSIINNLQPQPSKGERNDERDNEKPSVSDEGD